MQGGCSEHADAIQPYASNYIYIHDNYLHDNEQGIMSPDGVSTGYRITNNVIHTSTAYPCMHMGDTRYGSITHNVCRNGQIRVYGGNQNVASQNMVVRDNAAGHRRVGVLGLHHRPQPDRHLHRRVRALRLRDRVAEGHRV